MASGRKKSSSRGRSTPSRRGIPSRARAAIPPARFAICVKNDDYPASLELRKLYCVLEDGFAAEHGMVRVVDESGEDYLFPSDYFVRVRLPQAVEDQLRKIA
jgi:hypothetical protein